MCRLLSIFHMLWDGCVILYVICFLYCLKQRVRIPLLRPPAPPPPMNPAFSVRNHHSVESDLYAKRIEAGFQICVKSSAVVRKMIDDITGLRIRRAKLHQTVVKFKNVFPAHVMIPAIMKTAGGVGNDDVLKFEALGLVDGREKDAVAHDVALRIATRG